MDLAKAKGVIIALLLAFNLFLLYNNLSYYKDRGIQKETIQSAVTILKARGITLDFEIPQKAIKLRKLVYGNGKLDRAKTAGSLLGLSDRQPAVGEAMEAGAKKLLFTTDTAFVFSDGKPNAKVNINDTAAASRFAREYLEKAGLLSGKYVIDSVKSNGDGSITLYFIEKYDNYLVFDNYCRMTLSDKGVLKLEYSKLQILHFSTAKEKNEASAYQVLLANYQKSGERVITAMDIGYKYLGGQALENAETAELPPVWRVKMKGVEEPDYLSTVSTGDTAE
jgi:regulatory protein YycI of two-component signal transduction system YycFG